MSAFLSKVTEKLHEFDNYVKDQKLIIKQSIQQRYNSSYTRIKIVHSLHFEQNTTMTIFLIYKYSAGLTLS